MKRFIKFNRKVLALPIALTIASNTHVFASDIVQGAVTINNSEINAIFTELGNGKVSLGYGLGTDLAHTKAFTTSSTNEITITIPATITSGSTNYNVIGILQGALSDSTNATTITIEEGITTISEGAFEGCGSVTTINLPSTLLYLRGHNPFVDCTNLTNITYNGTVEEWNAKGFLSSYGSISVTFSDNSSTDDENKPEGWDTDMWIDVDGIDAQIRMNPETGAIVEVDSLVTSADIPEYIYGVQVKSIDGLSFKDCINLKFVSIPNGVTEIESCTFLKGALDNITYYGGTSLEQVCLPDTLTKIGSFAFYNSKIETIYIPSSVECINSGALYSSYISNIFYEGDSNDWLKVITNSNISSLVIYNSDSTKLNYTKDSTEISLSVSGIVGGNITFDISTGMIVGADAGITSMVLPEYIAGYKVVGITEDALSECTSLTYIALPEDATQIADTTFNNCSSLQYIIYYGSEAQWTNQSLNTTYKGIYVSFLGDFNEDDWIDVDGIDAQIRISKSGTILEVDSSVTSADIPEYINGIKVVAINQMAFANCTALSFVSIPNGVTEIESCTFLKGILNNITYYGGTSLEQVCLPDTLTKIGSYAFYNSKIDTIYIPSSVEYIDTGAFTSAYIGDILFGGTGDQWNSITGSRSVYNTSYTTLKFMNDSTEISLSVSGIVGGNITFDTATGMIVGADDSITMAKIPEYIAGYKVVGIDKNAFENCSDLRSAILYDNIKTIGENAFPNTGMTIYFYGTQDEWNSLSYTLNNNNLVIGKKDFILNEDANRYLHSRNDYGFGSDIYDYRPQSANEDGSIAGDDEELTSAFVSRLASLSPYTTLYEDTPEDYFTSQLAEEKGWGGSCFGVASTIGLVFSDYSTLDELTITTLTDEQDTYYELPYPVDDAHLYNSIMYYQVGQTIVSGTYIFRQSDGTANAKPLLDALDKEHIVMFTYGYGTGGHAILALDYKQEDDGSYIVTLFDENKSHDSSTCFMELSISADYSTYSFTPVTGPNNSYDETYVGDVVLTNDSTIPGYYEASYLRFLTLDDVYTIGPVYDSNNSFITGTSTMSIENIEENNMESETMLINIPMNSDMTITIGEQTISYKNGLFAGNMQDIEANPVEKGSASEWLLTVPNHDVVYVENNSPNEKDMNIEVFSDKGTLAIKAEGLQKAILDLNDGIEVMLADGFDNVTMKNYFKLNDELVSVESIISDNTKLFINDLTQSINIVSIGDAEISAIKNTLTGASNHLENKFDIKIDPDELKDFFSGWKNE